jgi:hypothetical protein
MPICWEAAEAGQQRILDNDVDEGVEWRAAQLGRDVSHGAAGERRRFWRMRIEDVVLPKSSER